MAEVPRTAAAEVGAPRRVAESSMLTGLIKPAHALLSYYRTDNLVVYTDRSLAEFRDLKC